MLRRYHKQQKAVRAQRVADQAKFAAQFELAERNGQVNPPPLAAAEPAPEPTPSAPAQSASGSAQAKRAR